jgi:hypothetical protein
VAARLKISARQTTTGGVALLLDARFPTGDTNDLLGAGHFVGRAIGIASSTFGSFSPHLNAGFLYTADKTRNHLVLATAGFDQLIAKGVTLALDLQSEFQVGESKLRLPAPVRYDAPFHRTIIPTTIPDIRDDIINGSFGLKFATANHLNVVTNALFPLNDGGLRPRMLTTIGLEYSY